MPLLPLLPLLLLLPIEVRVPLGPAMATMASLSPSILLDGTHTVWTLPSPTLHVIPEPLATGAIGAIRAAFAAAVAARLVSFCAPLLGCNPRPVSSCNGAARGRFLLEDEEDERDEEDEEDGSAPAEAPTRDGDADGDDMDSEK